MPDKETAHLIRGMVARAQVQSSDDSGQSQTVVAKIYEGVERSDIEVIQPFGLTSRAPSGGLGVVLSVGGDQGDLVMLPVADPASRMGGLNEGETALYNARGDRIHFKADGSTDIKTGNAANIEGGKSVAVKGGETAEISAGKSAKMAVAGTKMETDGTIVKASTGDGLQPRFVAKKNEYVKMSAFGHSLFITQAGIFSTMPITIASEPDPAS